MTPVGEIQRHGAYVCLRVADAGVTARAPVAVLAERLGLRNEFGAGGHPQRAIAFARRVESSAADIADEGLLHADVIVHVASTDEGTVTRFCAELVALLGPGAGVATLRGVVRPARYTGAAMHQFAYAHQLAQQPGDIAPHAFLVPLRKTADWWAKDWMERHTYILPRYDDAGRQTSRGHARSAEAGVACLMRRTYRCAEEPAPAGEYDFLNWFECAEADVATFREVCSALRDVEQNPEWRFVREGPTWHGRRVATWEDLFD